MKLQPKHCRKVASRVNKHLNKRYRAIIYTYIEDEDSDFTDRNFVTPFDHILTLEECDQEFPYWQNNPTDELIEKHRQREQSLIHLITDFVGDHTFYAFNYSGRYKLHFDHLNFKEFTSDAASKNYLSNIAYQQPMILIPAMNTIMFYDGDCMLHTIIRKGYDHSTKLLKDLAVKYKLYTRETLNPPL